VWNTPAVTGGSQTLVATLTGHSNAIVFIVSASNNVVLSGDTGTTGEVIVWSGVGTTNTLVRRLTVPGGGVSPVAGCLIPNTRGGVDQAYLAVGYVDGRVRIWNWGTSATTPAAVLSGHAPTAIASMAALPDRTLVTAGADGKVNLWETVNNTQLWSSLDVGVEALLALPCCLLM
jgi:WD40 repeat protein